MLKKSTTHSSNHGTTMETKAIQADLGIFKYFLIKSGIFQHIQGESGISRNYLDIFRTLCNPGIF